jgi:hypothetical protein
MESKMANILGIEYKIEFGTYKEYGCLETADGYTDTSIHTIVVDDMTEAENKVDGKKDLQSYQKNVLRHEIVHAFLEESGLTVNSNKCESWATNEEMIDWFAIQSPKIFKVFQELEVL